MNKSYEELKSKAFSAFRVLAREYPAFEDAEMLVGAAETTISLKRNKISKTIDTEWIDKIEAAIPAIDIIVRQPSVAIEDVDEILPIELSRHITEKSIKHLAQHTNLILDIKDDEVTPSKMLNVFHEETHLTYENKFVNTLLARLSAFVDKRFRALNGGSGTEANHRFNYSTEFEHIANQGGGRNSARIDLRIELTSPLISEISEADVEVNERYATSLERVKRINMALTSYKSSAFAQHLGRNYIRPPVIRTNAILKNKNLKECLNLWEYIENYDKVGYSFIGNEYVEMPSDEYVGGLYSPVALEYLTFYNGVAEETEEKRLLSEKHLFETFPEFDEDLDTEILDDYQVYDSEYQKTVPVSRLMNNRKKLSEDEKRIRRAIVVALSADKIINAELLAREAEERRLARERKLAAMKTEMEVRYRRSFLSRYIQSDDYVKDCYTEIKNELLSYKGVKARTSWSKESFKCGRTPIAKIDVKGKTVCLYLALDPKLLEGSNYKYEDLSAKGKTEHPVLIKIKNNLNRKRALELIRMLAEQLGLLRIDREPEDFRLPYEETDALIERGLIKLILPKGQSLDENTIAVKPDFKQIITKKEVSPEEAATEEATTEEQPRVESVEGEVATEGEAAPDTVEGEVATEDTESEASTDAVEDGASDELTEDQVVEDEITDEQPKQPEDVVASTLIEAYVAEAEIEKLMYFPEESFDEEAFERLFAPLVKRPRASSQRSPYSFADSADSDGIIMPYTRAQYLALPRKKKKSVLMSVKALVRYRATRRILETLRSAESDNPRMKERIRIFEVRLKAEEKLLPIGSLWENSVKRLKK